MLGLRLLLASIEPSEADVEAAWDVRSRAARMLHILSVQPTAEYRLHVRFDDGVEGEVDLCAELTGTVFEPLRNVELFRAALTEHRTATRLSQSVCNTNFVLISFTLRWLWPRPN